MAGRWAWFVPALAVAASDGCDGGAFWTASPSEAPPPSFTGDTEDAGSAPGTCAVPSFAEATSSVPRQDASAVAPSALAAAVAANNAFAVDLYTHVLADPAISAGTANVITSPISASIALTMTSAGAAGLTASQMASALHFGAGSAIFDGQNALAQALGGRAAQALAADQQKAMGYAGPPPSASDYALQIVNAVWGEKAYTWQPSFLDVLARSYGSGIYLADFYSNASADTARQAIDQWVSCETAGKIEDLLPPMALDCHTRMVLVDAIHLKMPWDAPFPANGTAPRPFTTGAGAAVMTPFMSQTAFLSYVDDGQAQVVALPLAGKQLSLVVAVPHGDLAAYEAALAAGSAALAVPAQKTAVALSLPRFTFTSPTVSLRKSLEGMGMLEAFGDKVAYGDGLGTADFSGLAADVSPPGQPCLAVLAIEDVLQKATIAVNETGVEAAAATAVVVGVSASVVVGNPPSVPVVADHPFLVAVVDAPTGAVLFLGHIEDPTVAGGP